MKRIILLCLLFITLLIGCAPGQPPQDQIVSPISSNLFYEYWGFMGYQVKNFKIENGVVSKSAEKWERGFAEAIPVESAEELARELGFNDYEELELVYGQLYHYKNYPIGKVYTFFGNYNGTESS